MTLERKAEIEDTVKQLAMLPLDKIEHYNELDAFMNSLTGDEKLFAARIGMNVSGHQIFENILNPT